MIFVILGMEKFPFDRMVKEIDSLTGKKEIKEPVFIQIGSSSYIPEYCEWERFLPFGEMVRKIREANLIIAHAGAGTTLLCLQYGKKPILVPRKKSLKEHVDDHQTIFAKRMQESDCANVVFDIANLASFICSREGTAPEIPKKSPLQLVSYLDNLLNSWAGEK